MTIAEIHSKTPFTYFEDLLTADVFTAFRYLPVETGIFAFLRSVPGLSQKLPLLTEKENISCTFYFWPIGNKYRREPDVLLALYVGSRLIHVVVEAKYLSGASDLDVEEVKQDGVVQKIGNQLGDQLRDLQHGQYRVYQEGQRNQQLDLASDPNDRYLLYLTAHLLKPTIEINRALAQYPAVDKLFWTSWYHVYEHFQRMRPLMKTPPASLILQDICLLLDRKGFASFNGFRAMTVGDIDHASASFWADKYLDDPAFDGIKMPPSFDLEATSSIFWHGN